MMNDLVEKLDASGALASEEYHDIIPSGAKEQGYKASAPHIHTKDPKIINYSEETAMLMRLDREKADLRQVMGWLRTKVDMVDLVRMIKQTQTQITPETNRHKNFKDQQYEYASPSTLTQHCQIAMHTESVIELCFYVVTAVTAADTETLAIDLKVNGASKATTTIDDTTPAGEIKRLKVNDGKLKTGEIVKFDLTYTAGTTNTLADVYVAVRYQTDRRSTR